MAELHVNISSVHACADAFASIASIAGNANSIVSESVSSANSAILDDRASSIVKQIKAASQALEEIQAFAMMYRSKLDNFASFAASKK